MKTSELIGAALDWAVAKAEGPDSFALNVYYDGDTPLCFDDQSDLPEEWHPSTDWAQGGPIIEREKMELRHDDAAGWTAEFLDQRGLIEVKGQTPLVAAMRCYVASKLGDTVEIPSDLT